MDPVKRVAWVALLACACGSQPTPTAPTVSTATASAPAATGIPPPSIPIAHGSYTLAGQVTESSSEGVRPSAFAFVNAWIQQERLGYSYWYANGRVTTDQTGRYELRGLPAGVTARLQVWKDNYAQQCAVPLLAIDRDVTLDAHLVSRASLSVSTTSIPPQAPGYRFVSGMIYEIVNGLQQPVAGAFVDYEPTMDFVAAATYSDAEGRYLLCGLPAEQTVEIGVGFQRRVTYVSVAAGQSTDVNILLPQ